MKKLLIIGAGIIALTLIGLALQKEPEQVLGAVAETPVGTRELVTGFEQGELSDKMWNDINGSPVVFASSTTATNGDPFNDYSAYISPAGAATEYLEYNVNDGHEFSMHVAINIDSLPPYSGFTLQERDILSFYDGTQNQCYATLGSDNKIRVYHNYNNNICSSSSDNYGTVCTQDSDCTGAEGEAFCETSRFAITPALDSGWNEIMLYQDTSQTNAGDVECGIYQKGFFRGGSVRPVGVCSGGDIAGNSCSENADCTGGGTCTTTKIAASTVARIGVASTSPSASTAFYIDDAVIANVSATSTLASLRIRDIVPTADGATEDWSSTGCSANHFDCVNDWEGALDDGGSTNLADSVVGQKEIWALQDITVAAGESIHGNIGIGLSGALRDEGSGTPSGKLIKLGVLSGGTDYWGINYDVGAHADNAYYVAGYSVASTTMTEALINALQGQIEYVQRAASNHTVRLSAFTAEVEIGKDLPAVPTAMSDQNGDGEITVTIAGDSRFDPREMYDEIVGTLEQVDNLLDCSDGSTKAQDLADTWTAILDGTGKIGSGVCTAFKGTVSKKADYVILDIGANDYVNLEPQLGECFGGTNDGGECTIEAGNNGNLNKGTVVKYCTDDFAPCTPATRVADCGVASVAGCALVDAATPQCRAGSLTSSSCPAGLCVERTTKNFVYDIIRDAVDVAQARTGGDAVKVILAAPALLDENGGSTCYDNTTKSDLEAHNSTMRQIAEDKGLDWIDLKAELASESINGQYQNMFLDGVHFSKSPEGDETESGLEVVAGIIVDCLEGRATSTARTSNQNASCTNGITSE